MSVPVGGGVGETDAYGLSMSYNPGLVGSTTPYLATLLPNGYWENAINGNVAGPGVGLHTSDRAVAGVVRHVPVE